MTIKNGFNYNYYIQAIIENKQSFISTQIYHFRVVIKLVHITKREQRNQRLIGECLRTNMVIVFRTQYSPCPALLINTSLPTFSSFEEFHFDSLDQQNQKYIVFATVTFV